MARYGSGSTEEPGQYPAPAWTGFGLPAQGQGTGAGGSSPPSSTVDAGSSNEPGQYPGREDFTGVTLDGTGAPGTVGAPSGGGGRDSVTYDHPTFYKGQQDGGSFDAGMNGYQQDTASGSVSGEADWTQANTVSYGPGWNVPGVEGNTPNPNDGPFQPGGGQVRVGGFMNGNRS